MRIEAVPFLFGFVGIDGGADHCVGPGDYWKRAQERCLPPKSHQISSPLVLTA